MAEEIGRSLAAAGEGFRRAAAEAAAHTGQAAGPTARRRLAELAFVGADVPQSFASFASASWARSRVATAVAAAGVVQKAWAVFSEAPPPRSAPAAAALVAGLAAAGLRSHAFLDVGVSAARVCDRALAADGLLTAALVPSSAPQLLATALQLYGDATWVEARQGGWRLLALLGGLHAASAGAYCALVRAAREVAPRSALAAQFFTPWVGATPLALALSVVAGYGRDGEASGGRGGAVSARRFEWAGALFLLRALAGPAGPPLAAELCGAAVGVAAAYLRARRAPPAPARLGLGAEDVALQCALGAAVAAAYGFAAKK
jgi:hypothetical protein